MSTVPLDPQIEQLLRELAPQGVAVLTRRFHDFAAAEDAVQEGLLAAALQWPRDGIPANPRGWLIQVAQRRLVDAIRSDSARRVRETRFAEEIGDSIPAPDVEPAHDPDDTLTLFFHCCHPSLTTSSAIALTLRAVGGLTTAEIARAFLVPEASMAQRISRAKAAIKSSGTPFQTPAPAERSRALQTVLHVLYLIFNEGYTASAGTQFQRADLAREAIRLGRSLHRLLPDDPEAAGLLALMLLTDARRAARTGPAGEAIPLDRQDRFLWDQPLIAEGTSLLTSALTRGSAGPYQLQAAIAALHDEAPSTQATDWPQILALYELLRRMAPSPVVALNHAVAAAMVHGPARGLELLKPLDSDPRLAGSHRIHAVRAHFDEMAGDFPSAIRHYRQAANLTASTPERDYLLTQAARLAESDPPIV